MAKIDLNSTLTLVPNGPDVTGSPEIILNNGHTEDQQKVSPHFAIIVAPDQSPTAHTLTHFKYIQYDVRHLRHQETWAGSRSKSRI